MYRYHQTFIFLPYKKENDFIKFIFEGSSPPLFHVFLLLR
eukprot:UN01533